MIDFVCRHHQLWARTKNSSFYFCCCSLVLKLERL